MFRISLIVIFIGFFNFSSASSDQCIGKCPIGSPNNDVYLIPHANCEMFCQCVFGRPVEMKCPPGLHYSEKDRVCADPFLANCTRPFEYEKLISDGNNEVDDDAKDCIEKCSWVSESFDDRSVTFSHRECRKFCRCNKYSSVVHKCPRNFHYSLELGICTYPQEANCIGITDDDSPEDSLDDCCECPDKPTSTTSPPTFTTQSSTTNQPTTTTQFSTASWTTTTTTTTSKPPSTTTSNPDASGCIGTCSIWDADDKVQHLPHKDCTKFCKCDFGIPKIMECPSPLFFNPDLQVCDRPSHAGCKGEKPTPPTSPGSSTKPTWGPSSKPTESSTSSWTPTPTSGWTPTASTPGDASGCIGTCSLWDDDDQVQHLPHQDCTKFCKCDYGVPVVFDCPPRLHFNSKLQVCDRPSAAGCKGVRPSTSHPGPSPPPPSPPGPTPPTPPPPPPTPGDTAGCIGTCSLWDDDDKVHHLPHEDCTKFCKCDFGKPVVINCPKSLHFNPILEVCDRPSEAQCTGIGGVPPEDDGNGIARKNILGFNKLFRW